MFKLHIRVFCIHGCSHCKLMKIEDSAQSFCLKVTGDDIILAWDKQHKFQDHENTVHIRRDAYFMEREMPMPESESSSPFQSLCHLAYNPTDSSKRQKCDRSQGASCRHGLKKCEVCYAGSALRLKLRKAMNKTISEKNLSAELNTDASFKANPEETLLGCSDEQFLAYISMKILHYNLTTTGEKMHLAYEDRNGNIVPRNFQFDHIKNKCLINQHQTEEEKEFYTKQALSHFTNIQPMLPADNHRKGHTWDDEDEMNWRRDIYKNTDWVKIYWPVKLQKERAGLQVTRQNTTTDHDQDVNDRNTVV